MRVTILLSVLTLGLLTALPCQAGDSEKDLKKFIEKTELNRQSWKIISSYLANSNPAIRAQAARALGRLKEAASIETLVSALNQEKDSKVTRPLIFALGQIPKTAKQLSAFVTNHSPFQNRVAKLKISLADREAELSFAVQALGKVAEPEQILILKSQLNHSSPTLRGRSAIAFALLYRRAKVVKSKELHKLALDSLLKALNAEKVDEVRWRIAYALAVMAKQSAHHNELAKVLNALLNPKEDNRTQCFAARGLGARGKALKSMKEQDQEEKKKSGQKFAPETNVMEIPSSLLAQRKWPWTAGVEAVRALAVFGHSGSWQRLCEFTKHDSFHVRRAAAKVLGDQIREIPDAMYPQIEKVLRKLLDDPWETARGEALVGLAKLQKKEAFDLISRFSKEGVTARRYAARALGALAEIGDREEKVFQALNKDSDHRVRIEIIEYFGKKKGNRGFLTALSALNDKETAVCGTAISALAERKEKGISEAFATLYRTAKLDSSRYEVREILCEVLGERGRKKPGETEAKVLEEALSDPRNSVRMKAAAALEKVTGKKPEFKKAPPFPSAKPKQTAVAGRPWIRVHTSRGIFEVELFGDVAPAHVSNIIHLIKKNEAKSSRNPGKPFYDGLGWHRVVSHFVVQGGCPRGDGWGDPGWTLPDELSDYNYRRGVLGMPKAGDDTGGCQLFFCHGPAPHLDGRYTIFGAVRKGFGVLDLLEEGDLILKAEIIVAEKK
jgi:cyclophilin family peptidyl-prolyl cis-trans isomerase/HEAT repeat protein